MKFKMLLIFALAATVTNAKINPDSTIECQLQPKIERYSMKVKNLKNKISQSNNSDSIKVYADEIIDISYNLVEHIKSSVRYKDMHIGYMFSISGDYIMAIVPAEELPYEAKIANEISVCAEWIRYAWSKNPKRIKKNILEIEEALARYEI